MKNRIKSLEIIALVALIGFSFNSCGGGNSPVVNGSTDGVFTLTGIPAEFNDRYAVLTDWENVIWGFVSMTSQQALNLPRITNGRVEIPIWAINNGQPSRWFDNATLSIHFVISSVSVFDGSDENFVDDRIFYAVPFVNGGATRTWLEGQLVD